MALSPVRSNELAAASAALGSEIAAAATFRLDLDVPVLSAFTPTGVGAYRVFRWLWQRVTRPRQAGSSRTFFLAVTAHEVAALELRYGRGVEVHAIAWRAPRDQTTVSRSGPWAIHIVLPDGRHIAATPASLGADGRSVIDTLTG